MKLPLFLARARRKRALRLQTLACALSLCSTLGATPAAADDVHRHDFDRAGDTDGWFASDARNCSDVNPGSGGNPGGYLEIDCKAYTLVGATSLVLRSSAEAARAPTAADLPQRYTGRWTVSVDLVQLGDAPPGVIELAFSGPSGSWSYMRSWEDAPQSAWRTYSVAFDASWSDGQAILNGWYPNVSSWPAGSPEEGWAATLRDVRRVDLYFGGPSQAPLRVGVDNFALRASPSTPPSP